MERAYNFKYSRAKCVVDLSAKQKNFSRLKENRKGKAISSTRRLENFINMYDNEDASKFTSKHTNGRTNEFKAPHNLRQTPNNQKGLLSEAWSH